MEDCLFCKINRGEIPSKKVYDDDRVFAIEDINPQAPTHVLIIPKKHLATSLDLKEGDASLLGHIHLVVNQIALERGYDKGGFRVVMNCGEGAGQSVFHIHFHLLAGRAMKWPPG